MWEGMQAFVFTHKYWFWRRLPTHTFKKMHKIMLRVEGIKYSRFSPEIVLHDFFISISN